MPFLKDVDQKAKDKDKLNSVHWNDACQRRRLSFFSLGSKLVENRSSFGINTAEIPNEVPESPPHKELMSHQLEPKNVALAESSLVEGGLWHAAWPSRIQDSQDHGLGSTGRPGHVANLLATNKASFYILTGLQLHDSKSMLRWTIR